MMNVVKTEANFIRQHGLEQNDLYGLICALKVNNRNTMSAFVTTNVKHAVPHLGFGAGLIYTHFGSYLPIVPRNERPKFGEWLLHFDNLLEQCTQMVCNGAIGQVNGTLHELYNAMLSCAYQFGAGLRPGYEVFNDETA